MRRDDADMIIRTPEKAPDLLMPNPTYISRMPKPNAKLT